MKEYTNLPFVQALQREEEILWINEKKQGFNEELLEVKASDIEDAEERLNRFAPFIQMSFPETEEAFGIIESKLQKIPKMKAYLNEKYDGKIEGELLVKLDSHLPIAGSIKARGGIYEVLKHTEDLALEEGLLTLEENYEKLASKEMRKFFGQHTIQVGSTGNLGLSIGISSAAIGYKVIVHMSSDAKQWKKDLLRSHGVTVKEYEDDYSKAVEEGRKESDQDPKSYFIDDENSKNLFMGYAVAARRLETQLIEMGQTIDEEHPLFVYIPCGVGGAPGGVTFGLKEIFQDNVHCFFVEPTQAPCMTLGMGTGLHNAISVKDIGLTGITDADGLAVGRPSGFVGRVMEPLLSGIFTLKDDKLYQYMKALYEREKVFIEPSAAAAFEGVVGLLNSPEGKEYIRNNGLENKMAKGIHIPWATGGRLVPDSIRKEYLSRGL